MCPAVPRLAIFVEARFRRRKLDLGRDDIGITYLTAGDCLTPADRCRG